LGTQVADANGTVTFTWQIPSNNDLGQHRLILHGAQSGSIDITFTVVDKALARTGSDLGGSISLGLMLLGAGAVAILISRRKRQET